MNILGIIADIEEILRSVENKNEKDKGNTSVAMYKEQCDSNMTEIIINGNYVEMSRNRTSSLTKFYSVFYWYYQVTLGIFMILRAIFSYY